MLQIFKLFPPSLVITTLIFVILPTFITFFMRISLYNHLKDLAIKTTRLINDEGKGKQPKFITQLEIRFSAASKQIENVNSLALIDGIYNQEKFKCFGVSLRCEEGEYITKNLPNLLLAFGLLGTFLGITLNLNSISQIINEGGTDIANLTSKLESPLQSMGIAFITSLIGLFCSSILTINNLKHNVNLEKSVLLNNLEDYLDNIYKPLVGGDTRLDKAVNKMVDKQTEFLTRFHEEVGKVLENTFGKAANRIADDNEKGQQLATQVYEQLFNVSSHLLNGANIFQDSMITLENQVNHLQSMLPTIKSNVDLFSASTTKFMDGAIKIENSKLSENLENITDNLAETQRKFTDATKLLANSTLSLKNDNKQAVELAKQVYQQLKNASENLEKSSVLFADSANTIKNSKFNENLVNATANLATIKEKFNQMANTLIEIVKPIETNIQALDSSIDKMVKVIPDYQKFSTSIDKLEQSAIVFGKSAITIKDSKFNENLVNATQNLSTIQKLIVSTIKTLNEIVKPIEINVKTLELSTEKMIILSQNVTKIDSNIDNINSRYLEMTNTSREILLKLGEISVKTNNDYPKIIDNLNTITQQFTEIFNNSYQSLIGESGGEGLTRYYELKGLTKTLIKEVKQEAKDINYLSKIEANKILTETSFKYLPHIEDKLRELSSKINQYYNHHIDNNGRKCTLEEAEIIGNELKYLNMELRNIHSMIILWKKKF